VNDKELLRSPERERRLFRGDTQACAAAAAQPAQSPAARHSREPSKCGNLRAHFEETRMSIAELVYEQVKALPEQLAREVLDFVGYLRDRQDHADRRDLMNAQAGSLAPVWDNAEDRVWDDA
jgi:hypothetical protein